jgi:hypothetical protein
MGDDFIDPNKATGEIVKGAMDSEVLKNLFGPLCTQLGIALGDLGDVIRFYNLENLKRLFAKWARQRNNKPLDEDAFKRVLPLLRDAAMQSDDELQERWAALLESTANGGPGVLPSFSQTLSQITADEARYLDRIWAFVSAMDDAYPTQRNGRERFRQHDLLRIYDVRLEAAPSPVEMSVRKHRMTEEQKAAFEEMTKFELIVTDLERLRLLIREVEYGIAETKYSEVADVSVPTEIGSLTKYALTQYGVNFILAVRPKDKSHETRETFVEDECVNRWKD